MPAIINTNVSSLNAQRNLDSSQSSLATALQRLSSGLRINSAKDDAAGLSIAERFTSQIRGNTQAARNANDGISLAQTAEGDLVQIGNNLQRIRELAVQSANATNSASDRAALQAEASLLIAEVDRVAANSSFNGVKLLDGTFTAQQFQVGANATSNDRITLSAISSARTTQLGGVGATTSATVTGTATTAALAAGDLTLNGQQVGASTAGAAPGQGTASAFSIASAINAVSSNSGVTATANATTVTGSAATVFTAIAANTFSINGVNVGAVAAGTTAAGQGANLAAAVNAVSTQTGVTAAADATTGAVTLTAADGRDIKITENVTSNATGVSVASTGQRAVLLAQTGFASGAVGVAGTTTVASGAFTSASSATATDIYTVTVDGISVTSRTGATAATAAQLDTDFGVFVAANTGYVLTGTFVAGTAQLTKADGTAVAVKTAYTAADGTSDAAGAVAGGALFGGAAPTTAAGVTVTAAAGSFNGTADSDSLANHGTISLSSTNAAGIVIGGASVADAGFTTGTTAATTVSSVSAISAVDISTVSGANAALAAIDGALTTVNSTRATLGAVQNRFASTIASLQTTVENLSASRSRIQDADFAAETAALSRSQILQQAGTAILAQANASANSVLSLLR